MEKKLFLQQLLDSCIECIRKGNLEKCFELLDENLTRGEESERIRNQIYVQEGRLNFALRERNAGRADEYSKVYTQITDFLLTLLDSLEDKHLSLLNRIHDQILVLTYPGKKSEWEELFPDNNFSHVCVTCYDQGFPSEYSSPDIVVFDDSGPDARPEMVRYAHEMPKAHFLYFGAKNPFTESRKSGGVDAAIFDRCANSNSKITVHARLRELLEFRKAYGPPS